MCAGCGAPIVVRQVLMGTSDPVVVAGATGCLEVSTTIYPYTSSTGSYIHTAFENAAATLSGVETAFRSLQEARQARRQRQVHRLRRRRHPGKSLATCACASARLASAMTPFAPESFRMNATSAGSRKLLTGANHAACQQDAEHRRQKLRAILQPQRHAVARLHAELVLQMRGDLLRLREQLRVGNFALAPKNRSFLRVLFRAVRKSRAEIHRQNLNHRAAGTQSKF